MNRPTFEPTDRSLMIGRRLRKLRTLHRLNMNEALELSGLAVTQSTLSRLELGTRSPRDGELYALAKLYGVTLKTITHQHSALDKDDYKLGDENRQPETRRVAVEATDAPKPGPHLVGQAPRPAAPPVVRESTHAALTSIPAHLPPQPSASAVMTPSMYIETVYVPALERKVNELVAQLAEANRLLLANGHREVS